MNCANHPESVSVAACQSCGKPLCPLCMRSVAGVVYCEPCLAARMSPPAGTAAMPPLGAPSLHAHPLLAGLLGFIPGVGAMYNGQFVKALAHVLIFAVFVSLSDHSGVFGLLVMAWIFYQVFDAAQTAKARRDGLPLPNPFGLNDLAARLGLHTPPAASPWVSGFAAGSAATSGPVPPPPAYPPPAGTPADPGAGWNPVSSSAPPYPPPYTAGYPPPQGAPYTPVGDPVFPQGLDPSAQRRADRTPIGAIVLIVIGTLLLLQTLGVFEQQWISRGWPVTLIAVGGWLLYRRSRDASQGGL